MLKSALAAHPQRSIALLYQVSDANHWPFGEVVHRWCQQFEALSVTTYFSRQSDVSRVEGGQVKIGKFTAVEVLPLLNESTHVYMCGPEPWMQNSHGAVATKCMPRQIISSPSPLAKITQIRNKLIHGQSASHAVSDRPRPAPRVPMSGKQPTALVSICQQDAIPVRVGSCKLKRLRGQVSYRSRPPANITEDENRRVPCPTRGRTGS